VLAGSVCACGAGERAGRIEPPRPSAIPEDLIAEGSGADCGDRSFRRFTDRGGRVSFCAPAGSRVGWLHVVEEKNTIEQMWFAPDTSCNFAASFLSRVPEGGMGPGKPPEGGTIELDEETTLAGRDVRHFRMRWHDHRDRSTIIDEHGRHGHEEASDHDVALERWETPMSGGIFSLSVRTQENTSDSTRELFKRMQATLRFERR
jgi:hypothetical protein